MKFYAARTLSGNLCSWQLDGLQKWLSRKSRALLGAKLAKLCRITRHSTKFQIENHCILVGEGWKTQRASKHVSALTASVVQRRQSDWRVTESLALCKNSTTVVRPVPTCLNHWDSETCTSHACRIVVLGLLNLNIKARHYKPEFLKAGLLLIHLINLEINWSWNIFTLHNFCCVAQDLIRNMLFCSYVTFYLEN